MFADMESFTFDRTSRTPQQDTTIRARSRSISPCSSAANAAALNGVHFTLTDLAAQFAGQRLRREAQICYDPCQAYANLDDDETGWQVQGDDQNQTSDSEQSESSLSRASPFSRLPRLQCCPRSSFTRARSPSQRSQRQTSARLLCSTAHHRDIAELVAKMVHSREQCSVVESPVSLSNVTEIPTDSILIAADDDEYLDDEGYTSGSNTSSSRRESVVTRASSTTSLSTLSSASLSTRCRPAAYRRASDRKNANSASVCKTTRFRRSSRPLPTRQ